MSCTACEQFQKSDVTSFFRWRTANIEVRGCKDHLAEVYACLRAAIECNYDAHLIEAAPELLENLKDMVRRFEGCLMTNGTDKEFARQATVHARAAITKAEGAA